MSEFPRPQDLKALRSFLGLASYYCRFIPGFSKVAAPLFCLTRKDVAFEWNGEQQQAFDGLKGLLTQAPVLSFPDFTKCFLLETDASGSGLGAVLAQKREDGSTSPVAYASRSLQSHEKNYGITELEALGVVWAIKHFRHYLYGNRCEVFTDHEALKALLNTPHPSGKLARWGLALQELDLHIHYRPGKRNANADALSRYLAECSGPNGKEMPVVTAATGVGEAESASEEPSTLGERQHQDPDLALVFDYLEEGKLPQDDQQARRIVLSQKLYHLRDRVLYHISENKTLRVIPPAGDRRGIFEEAHGGAFGGHLREAKMHIQLAKHYWWPGMRKDIGGWCRACLVCASRRIGQPVTPPLTPIPVAGPFDRIGVDVLKFPMSDQGSQYAIVFVDYLTKWPEVFPVADQSAITIARLLVEQVISRHGVPGELLSDRGAAFLSRGGQPDGHP